ncbi:MAG: ribonuclease H [Candidatus Magasanikbacteria bacterium CG_4_10_14_0_2_um_filter_37_12]|uniref:Ribonuclease H n=1 Tax=Candidatus Magasanikbacteria bacterium CG_4_10_14_0_2_um_filter_37_12 TaxID=1974637 RepID=A0A2M7V7S3_9BACT|nr:MAG: ribonuclease H [Candidatus Magasanikbacteria bacterium CG_4_10_14_0_2_um_filter_37_12]
MIHKKYMKLTIYTDGGSRGNPGPSATGIVIKNEAKQVVANYGEYLGRQTNNFTEYYAAISGLKKAKELGATEVELIVDSKLVCEQLNRRWKVKEPTIQKLFVQAWNVMQQFKTIKIRHTLRAGNKEADAEVNKVLDSL